MKISGLQKVTLLDFPGLVACTVFTAGCNLRCPFCQNASLVLPGQAPAELETEELLAFLRKRQGLLDGVAVTGGEPLLHPELPELLGQIRDLGYKIKLDTNGTLPDRLGRVLEAGLVDRVAMDIKNSPEKYPETVGVPGFDVAPVMDSAALLMESGLAFEFRTTVVHPLHQPEDFVRIGEWLRGDEEYYLQQYTDAGEVIAPEGLGTWSRRAMESFSDTLRPYIPRVALRGLAEE